MKKLIFALLFFTACSSTPHFAQLHTYQNSIKMYTNSEVRFYPVMFFDSAENVGDHVTSRRDGYVVIGKAGYYYVDFTLSTSQEVYPAVFKNADLILTQPGIISAIKGDTLGLKLRTKAKSLTLYDAALIVLRIGDY